MLHRSRSLAVALLIAAAAVAVSAPPASAASDPGAHVDRHVTAVPTSAPVTIMQREALDVPTFTLTAHDSAIGAVLGLASLERTNVMRTPVDLASMYAHTRTSRRSSHLRHERSSVRTLMHSSRSTRQVRTRRTLASGTLRRARSRRT